MNLKKQKVIFMNESVSSSLIKDITSTSIFLLCYILFSEYFKNEFIANMFFILAFFFSIFIQKGAEISDAEVFKIIIERNDITATINEDKNEFNVKIKGQ